MVARRHVWVARLHLAGLFLVAPAFWFPWKSPAITLLLLPVIPAIWLAAWYLRRRVVLTASLGWPLLCTLIASVVATTPVIDWQLGLPKVLGIALGASTLVAIPHVVTSRRAVPLMVMVLSANAALLVALGLFGVERKDALGPHLDSALQWLPMLFRNVVPNTTHGRINPNELAGVLLLLVPVLLAQAFGVLWRGRQCIHSRCALLTGIASLGIVLLTQSRSGIIGGMSGLALLAGFASLGSRLSGRLFLRICVSLLAGYISAVLFVVLALRQQMLSWSYSVGETGIATTLASRVELWDRATRMLQDFPFTGIGPGQFNPELQVFYPPFLEPPGQFMPHAHNAFLQYALDIGLPGATALAAVAIVFFRQCARAVDTDDPLLRWTGLGLAIGLLSFLAYGFTDAVALGARGGLMLWIVLGAGIAVGNAAREERMTRAAHS